MKKRITYAIGILVLAANIWMGYLLLALHKLPTEKDVMAVELLTKEFNRELARKNQAHIERCMPPPDTELRPHVFEAVQYMNQLLIIQDSMFVFIDQIRAAATQPDSVEIHYANLLRLLVKKRQFIEAGNRYHDVLAIRMMHDRRFLKRNFISNNEHLIIIKSATLENTILENINVSANKLCAYCDNSQ
jgi:hypothetical protein